MTSTFHCRVNWAHHPSQQDKMSTALSTLGQIISLSYNLSKWTVEDFISLKRKILSLSLQWSSCTVSACAEAPLQVTQTGQSVCIAATHEHASQLYACGVAFLYPLPHLIIEYHQLRGAKDFPCLFSTEKELRPLCKSLRWDLNSLSVLRNNSCITEKQSFGKFIALLERKDVCLPELHIQFRIRKSRCIPKFKSKLILVSSTGLQRINFRKNL